MDVPSWRLNILTTDENIIQAKWIFIKSDYLEKFLSVKVFQLRKLSTVNSMMIENFPFHKLKINQKQKEIS